jgi:CPA2 family monovalent cation:H+ antiporter-2
MHDMHNVELITTLTGALLAALVLGYFTHRIGLSPIVGYLVAGIMIGPHTPGFTGNRELAEQLAEVGVILLMFGVGLHFHLDELLAVRRVAIPGAIGQSLIATALGTLLGRLIGWDWSAGIVFGIALSVASTVVLTRVLTDNRDLHTPTGRIGIGWLVVEDLFTVMVLVLLPVLCGADKVGVVQVTTALGLAMLKVGILVVFTVVVGGRVLPWISGKVAATRSRELFTLSVLAMALGIAVGSAKLFDVSMALGAFLAGMVVGRSDFSLRAASEALPMRDAFAVLFFVSVGMLLNPWAVLQSPGLLLGTLAIILLGKPAAAFAIIIALRYPLKVAIGVAVALGQIGEFSFILASIGREFEILSVAAVNALVAAAIVSIGINPILYRLVDPVEAWATRHPRMAPWFVARAAQRLPGAIETAAGDSSEEQRAIVVGYGPIGQTVARLLRENEIQPSIIELNLETVRRLRDEGTQAVYGDARHVETLKAAGIATARALILSSAGMYGSEEVVRLARELNPSIRVLARSGYIRELSSLIAAGADDAFSCESEVALAMTVAILRDHGATPEQVDRECERVREALLGSTWKPDSHRADSQAHGVHRVEAPPPAATTPNVAPGPQVSASEVTVADDSPAQSKDAQSIAPASPETPAAESGNEEQRS